MKNIQVIDGAANSVFEVYQVSDDIFELMFPNGNEIAFLDEVEEALEDKGIEVWEPVYQDMVDKRQIAGIHGTLHFVASSCRKEYFPNRKESDRFLG